MPPRLANANADRVRLVWPRGRTLGGAMPVGFLEPGFRPQGEASRLGRGGAISMRWPDGRACFYREYRHGGVLGWLRGAAYGSARPLEREIVDSERLADAGIAVATPIVGRIERGAVFRLALVTERVEGTPLSVILDTGCGSAGLLRRVGVLCARLHEAGFRHKDLHPGNLIVRPNGEVVVLDLEGGGWGGRRGDRSSKRSLIRMARYVEKHTGSAAGVRDVLAVLSGYEPDRRARRALFHELVVEYRRGVRWHRLLWGRAASAGR